MERTWRLALRAVLVAALGVCLWTAASAKAAAAVEYLMVPSGAMGRDIPVAFIGGGYYGGYYGGPYYGSGAAVACTGRSTTWHPAGAGV